MVRIEAPKRGRGVGVAIFDGCCWREREREREGERESGLGC